MSWDLIQTSLMSTTGLTETKGERHEKVCAFGKKKQEIAKGI